MEVLNMEEKEEIKKALPPYLPYKTLRHFIDSMKVGMPNRIDRSLMRSIGGSLQSLLIAALEYLRLISPKNGIPEEKLNQLVKAEGIDRQKILKEIIVSSYTFLFVDGFDLQGATLRELQERFGQDWRKWGYFAKMYSVFSKRRKRCRNENISPLKRKPGAH